MNRLELAFNYASDAVNYVSDVIFSSIPQKVSNFVETSTTLKIQRVKLAVFMGCLAIGIHHAVFSYHASTLLVRSIIFGSAIGLGLLFIAALVFFIRQISGPLAPIKVVAHPKPEA